MKQDKKEKRNNILYSVLGLVLGIAMCGIGIYGMIEGYACGYRKGKPQTSLSFVS